jgi:hypothetical protein
MAVSFAWKVERLECRPQVGALVNVVSKVHWRIFDSEAAVQTIYGVVEVELDESEAFTPFEELTEETVVSWVQGKLGEEKIAALETSLTQAVNARIDPPVVDMPPPWMVVA